MVIIKSNIKRYLMSHLKIKSDVPSFYIYTHTHSYEKIKQNSAARLASPHYGFSALIAPSVIWRVIINCRAFVALQCSARSLTALKQLLIGNRITNGVGPLCPLISPQCTQCVATIDANQRCK